MIGIMSNNPDEDFIEGLQIPFRIVDEYESLDVDGLFIDWVPKIPIYEDAWMKQASLLQSNIKSGMPIVIFDRGISLIEKEVNWVRKFNVHLFEPALNSGREGFTYLPEWINAFEILIGDEERKYDIVYSTNNVEYHLKEFEKWFRDYARLFPDKKVAFSSFFKISDFKMEEYKNENLEYSSNNTLFSDANFTVAIDTKKAYEIGYFNRSYFFAMVYGCLPLLPSEHKYFHSMFKGIVVNDLKEMDYFVSLYGKIKDVIIEEIFDRVKKDWSEFTINHATDVIRNCYNA